MKTLDYNPVVLWGAGSQAVVLDELIRTKGSGDRIVAFFSDTPDKSPFEHVPVLCGQAAIEQWLEREGCRALAFSVAIGAGHGAARLEKIDFLAGRGLVPKTLIHPTAIALSRNFGRACQILAGAIVGVQARLGDGVILNTGAQVDHECLIGNGVHIGPGAILAGRVAIGDRTFVGTGARICPDVRVAADSIIGAGAVVIRDITEAGTYVGGPARRIK
jgi:sugar O-acyltransferase (sialic acid O-acetyltransferase NeuD family)